MTRLFVAAWPDAPTAERLRAFHSPDAPDEPGVRRVAEQNRHVTLRFIGEADPATAIELLGAVHLPIATAVLGPVTQRLDGRQVVVPVAGVDGLAAAVRSATASIGDDDPRPFRGHLTIVRTPRGESSVVLGAPFTARFTIDEVALVASDLQHGGAVYTTLATFPTHETDSP